MHVIQAVIFLPADLALDGIYVKQCLEHLDRRGYRLATIAREWHVVERLLRLGMAEVVIFARRSHIEPTWTPRFEIVGDTTREIAAGRKPRNDLPRAAGRNQRPRLVT